MTDSASNMLAMGNTIAIELGNCDNLTLQLCIQEKMFMMKAINALVHKGMAIYSPANKGINLAQVIISAQQELVDAEGSI